MNGRLMIVLASLVATLVFSRSEMAWVARCRNDSTDGAEHVPLGVAAEAGRELRLRHVSRGRRDHIPRGGQRKDAPGQMEGICNQTEDFRPTSGAVRTGAAVGQPPASYCRPRKHAVKGICIGRGRRPTTRRRARRRSPSGLAQIHAVRNLVRWQMHGCQVDVRNVV